MTALIGRLFGIENVSEIHSWQITFTAPWAQQYPVLLFFAIIAVIAVGVLFYYRFQQVGRPLGRALMATFRASLLLILLLIFAEPAIKLHLTERPTPLVIALFDGSDSMNIVDRLDKETEAALNTALTPAGTPALALEELSRADLVKQAMNTLGSPAFAELSERARIRAYVMDQPDRVREIETGENLAEQLTADGEVSALGNAIRDISNRHKGPLLSGVVVFSDFDKNAGGDPVAAARELNAPIFTVGVAPSEVTDLAIELNAPPVLKQDVEASVDVHIRQTGLSGQTARVTLMARRLGTQGTEDSASTPMEVSPSKVITLQQERSSLSMPFQPTISGRYELEARVEPFADEVLADNNAATRELTVRDESLRLFFVEDEPSWEWRFVKEVFHRDEMIGREGFRTFLRAADYNVRRANELFEENLVPSRAEFFANDVILLSDVPADMLTERFQDMLEEYVKVFGGGLVVIAGPRHGLSELHNTRIADMLPVIVDPGAKAKASTFDLQITQEANDYDFMNLAGSLRNTTAQSPWKNLGKLHWYQPVVRPHPLATVLATHPVERCVDNHTPQPIIATRRCEKGEVVYIGMNELWRLRRLHGEEYYKRFWGQLIYRLGLSRALGAHKRFVVETERPVYQAGDQVRVTAEAFSLSFDNLNAARLDARLISHDPESGQGPEEIPLSIPKSRGETVFETTFPVYAAGTHRLLVRDPETGNEFETTFKVAPLSIERRSAARNLSLQQAIASESGGKTYELYNFTQFIDELPEVSAETLSEHTKPLWNTWLVLLFVLFLMFAEWITRKLMNLR